ncbi:Alpha/beta hydrolase fold-1 [Xylaria bambusicola]|uniref:Alpha/beta hydrolase fold-1 n=1 Tax=Xylaria bambusicola TaxID=326684 RepID=UPI002008A1AA|nr:Alpha/beta hydrolase fold-1 [Xylaria bambusicola]KAI0521242.1 Alpha/beta hydrolase fold-1 [Xylaria bambusicola]
MSKPYFLLATGSFAPAYFYDNLVEQVKARGYDMKVIHLATVGVGPGQGRDTPPATMYDDAALIAKEVEALADEGREIILVAHSYGGMPATESTKGLSVQERQKAGKKGGIVRLAYKTVAVATPGHSTAEALPAPPADKPPVLAPDEKGWLHFTDIERSAATCFSDVPTKEEQMRYQMQFTLHSGVSFANPLTHAGYKDVPVSYLVCEDDLVIPADWQRKEIEMLKAETGNKVDVTSIKAGHCPTIMHLDKVVDWFMHVAAQ